MIHETWTKLPFFALFTNNGHEKGFKNAMAWSKTINGPSIDQISHPIQALVPILAYDYKNQVESLVSQHPAGYAAPDLVLVQPEKFVELEDEQLAVWLRADDHYTISGIEVKPRIKRSEYLEKVKALQEHIQLGDIYEVNFCMEFYAENVSVRPFELFRKYNALSKAPMAAYVKYQDLHLVCGSPERFLQKTGNTLLSQPIKGTRRRGADATEDEQLKQELKNDPKERAENIMIVDLVRNDLARIAERGSVKVEELCGIYSFEHVHQSISTIACTLGPDKYFREIVHALFPMGSMTGAPKIRTMELVEKYETTRRQWYSGSTGYLLPGGHFDLNVIIRSMVYDEKNKYLSFHVGSAITAGSDPEKEYEECLVKAQAMVTALNASIV